MKSKKWGALVLSMVMLLGILSGCGSEATGPTPGNAPNNTADGEKTQQPAVTDDAQGGTEKADWFGTEDGQTVTLRFWAGLQPEYGYAQMVENFNEEYKDKGVQVEFNRYVNNNDGNLQLETYLMGKDGVDVFVGYGTSSKVLNRAEAGMLYDYSDYLEKIGFDVEKELGGEAAANCIFEDGAVYGLSTKFDNNGYLMINKNMFEDAGIAIPYEGWTFDEFKDALAKLTSGEGQDKIYGICWGFNFSHVAAFDYISSVLDINKYFADDSMQTANLDNRVWIDGLQLIKDTMDNGWAVTLEDDIADTMTVQTQFLTEKCAIFGIFSQLRLAMDTENYPHDFTTSLVPFPVPSEDYASLKTQAHKAYSGDYISIASGCQYKEAACEFVRWYIQGGMNPLIMAARYPLWKGNNVQDILDVVAENAGNSIDLDSLSHLFSTGASTEYKSEYINDKESEIKTIVWEEAQNFLYGKTATAEEAMKTAQERANALLN